MAIKIFTFDKSGNISINRVEVALHDCFNKILRRDRGTGGDSQGKKKQQAFKELTYIYQIADVLSIPNRHGYSDKEREVYAKEIAGLEPTWKPDNTMLEAIDVYRDEQKDISHDVILELLRTFRLTKTVLSKVRQNIEKKLLTDAMNNDVANELLGLVNTSIKYGRDIPILTKELNKALTEIQSTIESGDLMRGSKVEVPDSAIPGQDY